MHGFEAKWRDAADQRAVKGAAALLVSERVDTDDMALAMRWACEHAGQIIDPHTAIAPVGRAPCRSGRCPMVTLATAHPAKFRDAVERATGVRPDRCPTAIGDLFDREERYATLPGTFAAVSGYVAERAVAKTLNLTHPDRRAMGRLRAGRQRAWPQAGTLWRLPLHPARAAGDVGTGLASEWDADGEFVPASDDEGGGRWRFDKPVPREGWPLAWNEVKLHRDQHAVPSPRLLSRHGAGVGLDARPVRRSLHARVHEPVRLYRRRDAGDGRPGGAR